MLDNAVYFPYIRVPESTWFTQVLLYWDNVFAIVPYEFRGDPNLVGPRMFEMLDRNLVTPILPNEIESGEELEQSFLDEIIDDEEFSVKPGAISDPNVETFSLHVEKMLDGGDALIDRGLARRQNNGPWLQVERHVADSFMAYLAQGIGSAVSGRAVTDHAKDLESLAGPVMSDYRKRASTIRSLVIKNILPAPIPGVDLERLKNFKDNHNSELLRFRNRVEEFAVRCAGYPSEEETDQIDRFLNDARAEIEHLEAEMNGRGLGRLFRGRVARKLLGASKLAIAASSGPWSVISHALGGITTPVAPDKLKDSPALNFAAYAVLAESEFAS